MAERRGLGDTDSEMIMGRRRAVAAAATALAGVVVSCGGAQATRTPEHAAEAHSRTHAENPHDEGLSATEDLMREHGVLERIFLVYDDVARRARTAQGFDPSLLGRAARLVRTFAEDYHERAEERFVFPVVRRLPTLALTVEVLRNQHARGRAVTDAILSAAAQGPAGGSEGMTALVALCEGFTRMYRPHAAREDTVIFPALRASITRHELEELGERMEEAEHASVGEGGFEHAVGEVAQIESALGLADLAQFTAPAPGVAFTAR